MVSQKTQSSVSGCQECQSAASAPVLDGVDIADLVSDAGSVGPGNDDRWMAVTIPGEELTFAGDASRLALAAGQDRLGECVSEDHPAAVPSRRSGSCVWAIGRMSSPVIATISPEERRLTKAP